MTTVAVRLAGSEDLDAVMEMLGLCIAAMRAEGIDQWDDIYPNRPKLLADAHAGTLYLGSMDSDELAGALVLNDHQDAEYADVPWSVTGVPVDRGLGYREAGGVTFRKGPFRCFEKALQD